MEIAPDGSTQRMAQRPSAPKADGLRFAHFAVCHRPDGEPETLGVGGMGTTYRAYDLQLERPVAVKTIHTQHVHDREARARFLREAKAAARLQNPHIAGILFQGEEDGVCFYVMELVPGETLLQYIQRNGPLHPAHALGLAHQVALALDAAHREMILHRDLKPGNIMLTSYQSHRLPHVKVIDFGLAKFLQDGNSSFVSMPGFLGTPGFASPEQCQELEVDARSDLYSLGVTLWFMLEGSPPFFGTALSVIRAHVESLPDFTRLPDCPEPVLRLLQRLMAKHPDDRPATAGEVLAEIEEALQAVGGPPVPPPPIGGLGKERVIPPVVASPWRRRAMWAGGVLVPLVLGVMAFLVLGKKPLVVSKSTEKEAAVPVAAASPVAPVVSSVAVVPAPVPPPVLPVENPPAPVPAPAPVETAPEVVLWTNSLGQAFRPLGAIAGRMAIWETRVRDYQAWQDAIGAPAPPLEPSWRRPGFEQTADHPVVWVGVEEARAFCRWLTEKEKQSGVLKPTESYRLPTRLEMDIAVGRIPPEIRAASKVALPAALPGRYAWGSGWPPTAAVANLADLSAQRAEAVPRVIESYDDGFPYTSPVGRLSNPSAFADLMGNVWEMIYDRPDQETFYRVGGSWATVDPQDLAPHQIQPMTGKGGAADVGFRLMLVDENDPKPARLPGSGGHRPQSP